MGVNYYSTIKIITLRPSCVPEDVGVNENYISIKRDLNKW
jgi:hypothetical protein